jgi:hypothetical protein
MSLIPVCRLVQVLKNFLLDPVSIARDVGLGVVVIPAVPCVSCCEMGAVIQHACHTQLDITCHNRWISREEEAIHKRTEVCLHSGKQ